MSLAQIPKEHPDASYVRLNKCEIGERGSGDKGEVLIPDSEHEFVVR